MTDGGRFSIHSYFLKYTSLNKKLAGPDEREKLAWNDDKTFLAHMVMLMQQKSIEVHFQEIFALRAEEHQNRKELTEILELKIKTAYDNFV